MGKRGTNLLFRFICLLMAGCLFARGADNTRAAASKLELFGKNFDINEQTDVIELRRFVLEKIEESKSQQLTVEAARASLLRNGGLDGLEKAERLEYFHPPSAFISKKERRGLKAIARRLTPLIRAPGSGGSSIVQTEIIELAAAVENNRRNPLPSVGATSLFTVVDQLANTVGGGDTPAANINCHEATDCDCSPNDSTFWSRPKSIADRDLYNGFGRGEIPDWSEFVWEYDKPKTSRGANPGFEIRSGPYKGKIKFAETRSEPFTTRVFDALGYNVDITDYVPYVRMKYDRRMFLEFNLRKDLLLNIRFFGLFTVGSVNMQSLFDPFDCIVRAELNSGERIGVDELRSRLLLDPKVLPENLSPSSFNESFENTVRYLITKPVNFQIDEHEVKSVGPWGFGELGHQDLREVRGAALLAAWVGWFDCRFDNTRLRLVNDRVLHYLSDLGGGLGKTEAAFNWRVESINEFPWTFTEAPVYRGKGRMTTPFKVTHFHTVMDNDAFKAMTTNDARWMAGLIAQLTRGQIVDALVASGHDAAQTMLYAEKLVGRRNRMVIDLGLEDRFGLLPREFEGENLDFDPKTDFRGSGLDERRFLVEDRLKSVVRAGVLIPRGTK